MQTTYKGFTIQHGIANSSERFFVISKSNADTFNADGYATLNNAKGAITKHITARDAKHDAGMEVLAAQWKEQDEQAAQEATSGPTGAYLPREAASVPATPANVVAGDLAAESDNLLALLRYNGFLHTDGTPKRPDYRSRNKREGRYAGCWHGLHMHDPRARKPSAEAVNVVADSRSE